MPGPEAIWEGGRAMEANGDCGLTLRDKVKESGEAPRASRHVHPNVPRRLQRIPTHLSNAHLSVSVRNLLRRVEPSPLDFTEKEKAREANSLGRGHTTQQPAAEPDRPVTEPHL